MKVLPVFSAGMIIVLFILSGCSPKTQEAPSQPEPQYVPAQSSQPSIEKKTATNPPQPYPFTPTIREVSLEADDKGFYQGASRIDSLTFQKDTKIKMTLNVNIKNVYYGGLDFRGCGTSSSRTQPGESTSLQFTADKPCTISSYWPLSNVKKADLQILVA